MSKYDDWLSKARNWKDSTSHRPSGQEEALFKGKYRPEEPPQAAKTLFEDPIDLQYNLGYKDRRYTLTYDTLKRVSERLSLISAILTTRKNQIAAFGQPYRLARDLGFQVQLKDPGKVPSKGDIEKIKEIEAFVYNCGAAEPNPHNTSPIPVRDDFETFLRKIVHDSLLYDQACAVAGSSVELADGTVCPIESIETGMKVRTHTGAVRDVLQPTSRLFSGDLITLKVRGQTLTVTEGHPVYAAKRTSHKGNRVELEEPKWYAASDLTNDMYVVYPRLKDSTTYQEIPVFHVEPRKYPVGDIEQLCALVGCHRKTARQVLTGSYKYNGPIKQKILDAAQKLGVAYVAKRTHEPVTTIDESWGVFIGLYLAEGNIRPSSVAFTFHEDETDLVEFVASFGEKYGISHTIITYPDRAAVTIVLNSKALSDFLLKTCDTGSSTKRVPEFVLNSPRSVTQQVLKHYLLGDANIREDKATFSSISRDLFTGIKMLLSKEGVYAAECISTDKYKNHSVAYKANISGEEYKNFARSVGLPTSSKKSRRSSIATEDHIFVKITSVESNPVVDHPVFNMRVAVDNSYVMEGFINHNCFEIVPDRRGMPYEFVAVDASTIRLAHNKQIFGPNETYHNRPPVVNNDRMSTTDYRDPYRQMALYGKDNEAPAYVQVVDGQIETAYTADELAFGIRNPRTDIRLRGYGYSEIEQLISIITAHLYAEEYNRRFFMQGSMPKGLLNLKGDAMTPDQLESLRRQWRAHLEGTENAWRTPIFQAEGGIDWINLNPSNREMEYGQWMEYLIKITSAVFMIDPAELNFDLSGGVQQTPLFESSSEWKLKASKDKGLKPLLRFLAKLVNDHVVSKIDDKFIFNFVGLNELSEQEKHELRKEQVASYMTLNEIRAMQDLPSVEGGDMIQSPAYFQGLQTKQQMEQMEQQQANAGSPGGDEGGASQGGGGGEEEGEDQDKDVPSYAGSFTKSFRPVLEISVDDDEEIWFDLWSDD